jgi:hypothetical protein
MKIFLDKEKRLPGNKQALAFMLHLFCLSHVKSDFGISIAIVAIRGRPERNGARHSPSTVIGDTSALNFSAIFPKSQRFRTQGCTHPQFQGERSPRRLAIFDIRLTGDECNSNGYLLAYIVRLRF